MKALINYGPGRMDYGDWAEPQLGPGQVLVEVGACGICGSDLHPYRGMPSRRPVPGIWGHEFAGTVLARAEDVEEIAVGARVAVQPLVSCGRCPQCRSGQTNICRNAALIGGPRPGGFAERVAVPARSVFALPEGMDIVLASLAETLATPVHLFSSNVRGFLRSALILGAGPQGLLCAQLARHLGARTVIVSDVVAHRLAMAEAMGATHVVDARQQDPADFALAATGGEGVDLAIDAAGRSASRQQAVLAAKPGGTAVFLATGPEQTPLDFMNFVPREVHLRGTQCYTDADFAMAIDLLAGGEVDAAPMLTVLPLAQGAQAFEALANDPGHLVKVMLRA